MFKKKYLIICTLFAILAILPTTMPDINIAYADGKAEIAMELTQNCVLYEKNADCRLPMASTTKIMTAIIIAEDCNLDEQIKVPDESVGIEGSSIYLKHDELISVKDLLYGLMLRSGNDAATALAIHHSGSIENFVSAMNTKAIEIGAEHTHFANPSGLPDDNHYTTARDLCLIACYAMKNPVFAEVVSSKSYSGDYRSFTNKNKILYDLEGANGIKTGYTLKAGRCLVSSAKRNNMDVVCVVLNCYDMYERSKNIIENCFDRYCVETISQELTFNYNGQPCRLSRDYDICIPRGSNLIYEVVNIDNTDKVENAIAKLKIYLKNDLIFSEILYSI